MSITLKFYDKIRSVVESGMIKIAAVLSIVLFFGLSIGYLVIIHKAKKIDLVSPVVTVAPTLNLIKEASTSALMNASPSGTPESSPSATPSPEKLVVTQLKTVKNEVTATPTPTYSAETAQAVNEYIDKFSAEHGVDPNVIRHLAICESGFRTNAINLGYAGLFQFDSATWKRLRLEIGEDPNPDLRFSGKDAVQTVTYAISKNKSGLWPSCFPN